MLLRRTMWFAPLLLLASTAVGETRPKASPPSPTKPLMIVANADAHWDESTADAEKVFQNAAAHLWRYYPQQDLATILVDPKGGPIILHRRGANGEYLVRLDTGGRLWAQHAFQFGHEFTHILCRYQPYEHPNRWFEESLCETGSLFVLRRMAESWQTHPPYPNWRDYAPNLSRYADDRLRAATLSPGMSFLDWFRQNEPVLRTNAVLREKNNVVAAALLPLFERTPQGWETVAWLNGPQPATEQTLAQFFDDWRRRAPPRCQPFLREIRQVFGMP